MSRAVIDDESLRLLAAFALDTNLRRAAVELGLPRSTLSRHLGDLEGRLEQPIFLRRGRTLTMTAFGERLVAQARAARDALRDVEATAREPSQGGRTITIAVSPLFAEIVLPGVLSAMCERYPTARVQLALSHSYSDLFDDRVDVALRRGPLDDSTSLIARRLGRLSMVCVGARGALPDRERPLDEQVRAMRWVRVGASLEPFTLSVTAPRSRSLSVTPHLAVDSQRLALELVLRGVGVARLNAFLVRGQLAAGELVEVLPEARESEAVFAVYPRRARPDPLVRDFVAVVVERCRALDIWDA
jgi:DNA-binding transcriptional LysR family regulator